MFVHVLRQNWKTKICNISWKYVSSRFTTELKNENIYNFMWIYFFTFYDRIEKLQYL